VWAAATDGFAQSALAGKGKGRGAAAFNDDDDDDAGADDEY